MTSSTRPPTEPGDGNGPEVLELAGPGSAQSRPLRRAVAVVASLLVVAALVVTATVLRPEDADVEIGLDEETTTSTAPDTGPDAALPRPAPLALGAPDDGKDSIGLPITVDPASGLVDGQPVVVTGSGFPAGQSVGVVMCLREAARDHGAQGIDACDIGHFAQGTSDGQGITTVEFSVRRFVAIGGQEVDCASDAQRCLIGMGLLSDYDVSGGAMIDFDPDAPAPLPPIVDVGGITGLSDGDVVDLAVSGVYPGTDVVIQQCVQGGGCVQAGWLRADSEGAASSNVTLWRQFGAYGAEGPFSARNVDCAHEACSLVVQADAPGHRQPPAVPLDFSGDGPTRPVPVVSVLDDRPTWGDPLDIEVHDVPARTFADAMVCSADGATCAMFGAAQNADGGKVRVTLNPDGPSPECAPAGCLVVVNLYRAEDDGPAPTGPPQLLPAPVPISFAG